MFQNVHLGRDASLARPRPLGLQLEAASLEAGLRFKNAQPLPKPQPQDAHAAAVTRYTAYTVLTWQLCNVLILVCLVVTLAVTSFRVTDTINAYYGAMQPYMGEMGNHSLSIIRHADLSSEYLEQMMLQGSSTAAASLPAMEASVNRTAEMVASLQRFSSHPTVQMSLL